jgi:hypothetical protein
MMVTIGGKQGDEESGAREKSRHWNSPVDCVTPALRQQRFHGCTGE